LRQIEEDGESSLQSMDKHLLLSLPIKKQIMERDFQEEKEKEWHTKSFLLVRQCEGGIEQSRIDKSFPELRKRNDKNIGCALPIISIGGSIKLKVIFTCLELKIESKRND
jgi:hypothetical protein